jgi:hypothetical protein
MKLKNFLLAELIRVKSIIKYISPELIMGIKCFANKRMNIFLYILNILVILSTLILTIVMILVFRTARPINYISPLLSILVCIQILVFFMVISGSRLNLWLGGFLLLAGSLIGLLRGLLEKLAYHNDVVVGSWPLFFLLIWGISLAIAQSANLFGSSLISSFGLIPLVFTTGIQVGISSGIFLRRIVVQNPARTR